MLDYLACSLFFLLYVLVEFPLCDASILDDEGAERLPPFFLTTKKDKDPDALHIAHKCFIKS